MFMSVYVNIYNNMHVYAILSSREYTRIYAYIQNFKHFEKLCITAGFEPVISCILSSGFTTAL